MELIDNRPPSFHPAGYEIDDKNVNLLIRKGIIDTIEINMVTKAIPGGYHYYDEVVDIAESIFCPNDYDEIYFNVWDKVGHRTKRYCYDHPATTVRMFNAMNTDGVRYSKRLYGMQNGKRKVLSR